VTQRKVRELAEELAVELSRNEELDAEAKQALASLFREVDRALSGEPIEEQPSERALGMVERLEREHPDLTALVQRLADALMAAGL
jgi:uncharacterized protein DUF4404